MQTALSSGVKGDAHPLPYNLYASNKVKKRTVKEHYSDPCSICTFFQIFFHSKQTSNEQLL